MWSSTKAQQSASSRSNIETEPRSTGCRQSTLQCLDRHSKRLGARHRELFCGPNDSFLGDIPIFWQVIELLRLAVRLTTNGRPAIISLEGNMHHR